MSKQRRDRGTGSVYPEASGQRWVARVELPPDPLTGRRRQRKLIGKTKAEVRRRLADLQRQQLRGEQIAPSHATVGQLLTRWLETVHQPRVEPSTYERAESVIRCHLLPAFSTVRLDKLCTVDLQSYYARCRVAASTLRIHHAILRQALQAAVRWGLLSRNPADGVVLPKRQPKAKVVLDNVPAQQFLAAVRADRWEAVWVLALTTGARIGELLALRWADIDLEAQRVTIQRKVLHLKGGVHGGQPKSAAGCRVIPLRPSAVAALRRHRARQLQQRLLTDTWHDPTLVFTTLDGRPLRAQYLSSYCLPRLLERAGLPRFGAHGLRHSALSLMLKHGADLAAVARIAGHSSPTITLGTYRHILSGEVEAAIARLGQALDDSATEDTNGATEKR